jgi:hypothetical protein
MSNDIQIDGKSYISSKRAAELSGYAQDYIGQLARKSLIDARRIGGLWYVSMESLQDYKKKAEEFKPEPPARVDAPEPGTLVFFDGKEYLSAARAAEQTGYTQDYVGQLARSGTILSRQVGNRWYVERGSILGHKSEKDRLLAAVQAESVGLPKSSQIVSANVANTREPLFNYFTESLDLIPNIEIRGADIQKMTEKDPISDNRDTLHRLPIRRISSVKPQMQLRGSRRPAPRRNSSAAQRSYTPLLLGAAATIVIVLSVGYASVLRQNSVVAVKSGPSGGLQALKASVDTAFSQIGDILEPFLTHDLVYQRATSE